MEKWWFWIIQTFIVFLIAANSFWIKRWINSFDLQKKRWDEEGGIVTRDLHFDWCEDFQAKCPAYSGHKILQDWRNSMLEKGGPLTRLEHMAMCKEISKEIGDHFCKRLDEMFEHHQELVSKEFELLRKEIIAQLKPDETKGRQFMR